MNYLCSETDLHKSGTSYFNGSEPGSELQNSAASLLQAIFPNVSENMRHDSYRLQKTVYTLTDDNYIIHSSC